MNVPNVPPAAPKAAPLEIKIAAAATETTALKICSTTCEKAVGAILPSPWV